MRSLLSLSALLIFASPCQGQRGRPMSIQVRSCPVADSLLGPMRKTGSVWATFRPGVDSGELNTAGSEILAHPVTFSASLPHTSRNPTPYPAPVLNFVIHEQPLATAILGGHTPALALLLDDSTRIDLGAPFVGQFRGPAAVAAAPLTVTSLPAWALTLARAGRAWLVVDSAKLRIEPPDLGDYQALYRAAVCDTIPVH